jgi:hypothetical protein
MKQASVLLACTSSLSQTNLCTHPPSITKKKNPRKDKYRALFLKRVSAKLTSFQPSSDPETEISTSNCGEQILSEWKLSYFDFSTFEE